MATELENRSAMDESTAKQRKIKISLQKTAVDEQENRRAVYDLTANLKDLPSSMRDFRAPDNRVKVDFNQYNSCPLDYLSGLDPRLKTALRDTMGYTYLLPAQVAVWHEVIGPFAFNRDLYTDFPPGSGKTLAYVLPILQRLSTRKYNCIQALVVLPNHELAVQVKKVFDNLAPAVGLSVGLADGNFNSLEPVEILVATPRSLIYDVKVKTNRHALEILQYLVVDETDLLITEPFKYWLPTFDGGAGFMLFTRLATIYLSDTLNQDRRKLAKLDLDHPLLLMAGERQYQLPQQLKSYKVVCTLELKPFYLLALLGSLQGETCIVFTNGMGSAERLCNVLNFFEDLQLKIKLYSRLQPRSMRSETLGEFRTGKIQVLICPDETERAVEVEEVKNVINYDLPAHGMIYVHRAFQTARAGASGNCFTFFCEDEAVKLQNLLLFAASDYCPHYPVPFQVPESLHATYKALELKEEKNTNKSLLVPCKRKGES